MDLTYFAQTGSPLLRYVYAFKLLFDNVFGIWHVYLNWSMLKSVIVIYGWVLLKNYLEK